MLSFWQKTFLPYIICLFFLRNMACHICNVKFEYKNLYNKHMATVHNVEGPEKKTPCELCGKLVTNQRWYHLNFYLSSHIITLYVLSGILRDNTIVAKLIYIPNDDIIIIIPCWSMWTLLFWKNQSNLIKVPRFLSQLLRRYRGYDTFNISVM